MARKGTEPPGQPCGSGRMEPTGPGARSPRGCAALRHAHLELAEPVLPRVSRARLLCGGSAATASAGPGHSHPEQPRVPLGTFCGATMPSHGLAGSTAGSGDRDVPHGAVWGRPEPAPACLPRPSRPTTRLKRGQGPAWGRELQEHAWKRWHSCAPMAPGRAGTPRGPLTAGTSGRGRRRRPRRSWSRRSRVPRAPRRPEPAAGEAEHGQGARGPAPAPPGLSPA